MNLNDSSSGNSRGFNKFQGPRSAIKMESNRSGQSYQSGFGVRRGNDDRSQNTSPGSNPFRKAQRLYHMTAVPSSVVTMPEDDTQNSACQTTFEDEAVSAHDTSLEYDVPYHKADDENASDEKPKQNGEKQYRMVIDFKRLNAVTISDTYLIPDINSTLPSLGRAKYFTTIDLTSGFHQIHMNEKDIRKTAFSTLNGKYEFLRLPFGLKNALAIFQRMIDDVLREHIGKICYVYIDDIIVFGEDYQSHWNNLRSKIFGRPNSM
ncbi:hypothetical protein KR067_006499 [Drosophila pandora]|nr:hypothetical protein KR067_006499 [Drosophila pandora]